MNTDISIILDTRRAKKYNTYPVKLRVYSPLLQKAKTYSAKKDLTIDEFENVMQMPKPRKKFQEDRDYLDLVRAKAIDAAKKTEPFSFETFEKKLQRRKGDNKNVVYHFNQKIDNLKSLNRYGTAESYDLSLKSIKKFIESKKGNQPRNIFFNQLTPTFLQQFENFMIKSGKSETTVGIYLRALRSVFNQAIKDDEVSQELYPFGKDKYQIPAGRAVKKALTKQQLKVLLDAEPQTPEQEKAKDFWFFSFISNGMNIHDIALLKYGNIKGNTMEYKRAKTRHTTKNGFTKIVVHLTDLSRSVIEKYGNESKEANEYIFSIINKETTAEKIKPRIKNFTRFVNQHIKLLAKANGLPEEISTYWARHTFATVIIRGGASMEFVKEAFGHQNIATTQNYFAGFENDAKRNIVENLLKFD